MTTFVQIALESLAPPWLMDKWGERWLTALAEEKDLLQARMVESVTVRFPSYAPVDALPDHAFSRNIDRAPGESAQSFQARLLKAWDTWLWSGTDVGVMFAFQAMGWRFAGITDALELSPEHPTQSEILIRSAWDSAWPGHPPQYWSEQKVWLNYCQNTQDYAFKPMFIGGNSGGVQFDTWQWDGSNWIQRYVTRRPERISAHAAAQFGQDLVVFGGTDGSAFLADTWVFHMDNWMLCPADASPPARVKAAMAELGGKLYLYGGQTALGAQLTDFWAWDGRTWTELSTSTSPGPLADNAMVRFGDRLVLFGGVSSPTTISAETWVFDGTDWTRLALSVSPSARTGHRMVALQTGVLLFGGYAGGQYLADTWLFDGQSWTQLRPNASPPGRCWHGLGAAGLTQALLFGGELAPSSYADDTWLWDGTDWVQLHPSTSPILRCAFGSMAYRPKRVDRHCGEPRAVCGADITCGTAYTSGEIETMRTVARKWKDAAVVCRSLQLIKSPGGWSDLCGPYATCGTAVCGAGALASVPVGEP